MLAGAPSITTLAGASPTVPLAWKPTGPWLKASHEVCAVAVLMPPAVLSTLPVPPEPTAAL